MNLTGLRFGMINPSKEDQLGVRRLDPTLGTLEWRALTDKKGLDIMCRSKSVGQNLGQGSSLNGTLNLDQLPALVQIKKKATFLGR